MAVRTMVIIRAPRSSYSDSLTLLGGVACRRDRTGTMMLLFGHEGVVYEPIVQPEPCQSGLSWAAAVQKLCSAHRERRELLALTSPPCPVGRQQQGAAGGQVS